VIARHRPGLRRWYESAFATLEIMELDDLASDLPGDIQSVLTDAGDSLDGSLLMVPLVLDGALTGIVGLRYERPEQMPSSSAWIVLDIFAHILERVIQLKRSEDALLATNRQLNEKSAQLVQSEKMASIGQMAAGVAHEINNPVGFVMSNLGTLRDHAASIKAAIDVCCALDASAHGLSDDMVADLEFLRGDLDDLLDESLEGCERVRDIVQNMKGFARIDDSVIRSVDLNECVESTLKIVWNELKYRCQMVKEYGELPAIACYVGKINQVILNLLVNAAQAIADKGTITISTAVAGEYVELVVTDTGCGIADDKVSKIFDPFYTTKDPGKGTGLGLYICHSIVEEHGGTIAVASIVGVGTTFTVRLPLAGVGDDREDTLD
jgi:two-component system, NtrC family, sensor kinase